MIAAPVAPGIQETTDSDLRAELLRIERRLYDGYDMIDRALDDGVDVGRWEGHWLKLLREYEELCELLVA